LRFVCKVKAGEVLLESAVHGNGNLREGEGSSINVVKRPTILSFLESSDGVGSCNFDLKYTSSVVSD
jgi:hypothetical protein